MPWHSGTGLFSALAYWYKVMITAGLNVDLDPFFELAELMVEMS